MDDIGQAERDRSDNDSQAPSNSHFIDVSELPCDHPIFTSVTRSRPHERHKSRPAHFLLSTKHAQKSALRTTLATADCFLLSDSPATPSMLSSRIPGTFGRRIRPKGDALPGPKKKVQGGAPDSDEKFIMQLRGQGPIDVQISEHVAEEKEIRYGKKTISSRVGRMRAAQAAHHDFLLEEGYREWTYSDDQRLMQAYEYANVEVLHEIEEVRASRFKKVAEYMRRLTEGEGRSDALVFSEKACRERHTGLVDGTVCVPSDMCEDPEARRGAMENWRAKREQERAILEDEQRNKSEADIMAKAEEKVKQAEKMQQWARERTRREEEKAKRATEKAAKEEAKRKKAEESKAAKQLRADHTKYKQSQMAEADRRVRAQNRHAPRKIAAIKDLKTVTADTPDPRAQLSLDDLRRLCRERNLEDQGTNHASDQKTKSELLQRLGEADDAQTLAQLKTICRMKGMNVAGTKAHMKYQLARDEAQKFPSFAEPQNSAGKNEEPVRGCESEDDEMADSSSRRPSFCEI